MESVNANRCSQCGSKLPESFSHDGLCQQCRSSSSTLDALPTADGVFIPTSGAPSNRVLPDHIGPYKILDFLGEGGMGAVYLAEQERPIRRRVALKVIKLGMDTEEVVARFESERQALAMMNHPNIARVFDAGTTERGLPYFVMEYVPGIPICDYCDRQRLNTRERLGLFVLVCLAIQHAHQKGIIHRDIKPSNVLVSFEDGKPMPKVIDFGVAKAVNQRLTEKTLFTQRGILMGTPAYMSPEQADLTGLDVDTRTDIYSLGVLLYEMLVGALPFDSGRLNRAGYAEIQRIIRDEDPPAPTKRLQSLGATAIEIANRRNTTVKVLGKQLSGDLDWITMKAMEKDRARRYASASEFAADIHQYLTQEPVSARPPTMFYRLGKFTRRHRIGITVAVLLVMSLIGGIGGTTIGLVRARKAEKHAQKEAAQARAINSFLQETLGSANPFEGRHRDITVLEALESSVSKIHDSFVGHPEVEAELKQTVGVTFLRLGRYDKAEALLKESLQIYQQQLGPDDPKLIAPLNSLAILKQERGGYREAENYFRRALALGIRKYGEENSDVSGILCNLALLLQEQGNLSAAEPLMRKNLQLDRKLFGEQNPSVAVDLNNLGRLLLEKKEYEEGTRVFEEARSIFQKEQNAGLAICMGNQGELLIAQGDYQKAEAVLAEALGLGLKQLGERSQDVAKIRAKYGSCLIKQRNYDRAEEQLGIAFALLQGDLGMQDKWTQRVIRYLVELYDARGDQRKATQFRALLTPKR
jgi:serine/threonine protein kinase/Tfp pilus assembly protein PilF